MKNQIKVLYIHFHKSIQREQYIQHMQDLDYIKEHLKIIPQKLSQIMLIEL